LKISGFKQNATPVVLEPWHSYLNEDPSIRQDTLKLLSYNIQVGIHTKQYRDYVLKAWQHLLPSRSRLDNLDKIAQLIQHFDLIALQEVDGGSIRTQYINQVHYLAKAANKTFWHQQRNRNFGRWGQHSNGVIANFDPIKIDNHSLPGLKGRGAIAFEVGEHEPLIIVIVHLALTRQAQNKQLIYIKNLINRYRHAVVMGDMNTDSLRLLSDSPLSGCGLKSAHARATYPSWQPIKCFDQILVSQHLNIVRMGVLDFALSDHLPVAIEIERPF
jgi:endonuclease/exonuclease/phosphatase family metal-dependent hydrolase